MQGTNLFILLVLSEGIISQKLITQPELYVTVNTDASIVLNCTYVIENSESVSIIEWRRKFGSAYSPIARFSPNTPAIFMQDGIYLKNRSDLISPGNGSTSAILTINDVICKDDGHYRCVVQSLTSIVDVSSNTTVFIQADAEQPINFSIFPNNSLEENDTVTLSCYANVGNPDGYVTIWRVDKSSTPLVLLNETNIAGSKTENCTTLINATVTYNISRNDNGAYFICSSQNRLTQGTAPRRDINPIEVSYGPSKVRINVSHSNPIVTGSNVNLKCSSDGNPAPTFKWTFNSSVIENSEIYTLTSDSRMLSLRNINLNHSGIYVCMASNSVNRKTMNGSFSVWLDVTEKKDPVTKHQSTCEANPCGITERCYEADGKASCATDTWSVVALVFIVVCLIFMVTTIILCIERRNVKKNSINVDVPLPLIEGDDFGGYADPMDVKILNGQVENKVNDTEEHGDPVDQTSQYASVQKSTSPADASNPPNVYDGAWN